MEEFRKRLEEKNAKGRKLLEEERLMFGKQEVAETSRTVDVEETQMDESRDTEYNLLDSMVNPKEKDPQLLEDMLGNERTIPQTPLIEGVSGNLGYDETMNDERQRMTAILESSIRTERTIVVEREYGNLKEEPLNGAPR